MKTDIRVGAYIFPGWHHGRGESFGEWKLIAKFAKPRPVLGFYDDSMPEVNDWHIKWALDAGISWFAFDWYWNSGVKHLHRTLEDGFLKARYQEMMDFCVHWCNHPIRSWPPVDNSAEGIEEMVRYCAEHYFTRPNYLKISGRPVFMIWRIEDVLKVNGGAEGFARDLLPALNAICHEHGLGDLFIVLVNNMPGRVADCAVGDAVTGYSYSGLLTESVWSQPGSAPYSEMVEALPQTWERLHNARLPFITSTQSGWDDMPRTLGWGNDARWARTGNTLELFEQTLREGKSVVKPELPFFLIEAWNEWGEGSFIEPSKELGFEQLAAVRRVFAPDAGPSSWPRPTAEQVDGYSILQGEALQAAREREKQPDPAPTVKRWSVDVIVDPQEPPGRVIAEWRFEGEHTPSGVGINTQLERLGPRDGGAGFKITGGDPQFLFEGDFGELAGGWAVCLRARYSGGPARNAEFFWSTQGEQLSGANSRRYHWRSDEGFHTYLLVFGEDHAWSGRLTSFRIDPPVGIGATMELEWVRVLAPGE